MPKRIKVGDIIEIKTNKGLSYAQYTHKDDMMGILIHIFKEIYDERPENLDAVVKEEVQFSTFFPLGAAVNRKIFEVVGHSEISRKLQKFPLFRNAGLPGPDGVKVKDWWLWDGKKSWKVRKLTKKQRKLPIKGACNDTMLIYRIETGYTPEKDPENP